MSKLKSESCPLLLVKFADGKDETKSFDKAQMISDSNQHLFRLELNVDHDEFFYFHDQDRISLTNCNQVASKLAKIETDTSKTPSGILLPQQFITDHDEAETNATTSNTTNNKVVGYVIFSELTSDFKSVRRAWFTIDDKPGARFPIPNDVVTAARQSLVYSEPFHWDPTEKKHVVPKSFMKLAIGQKARIGGDAIIARDETTNLRYVISPLVDIIGTNVERKYDLYPPSTLPMGIKGYAYLGYLSPDGSSYSDRTFNNFTEPDALYPLPGDTLLAITNVWLRAGPRRWDPDKQDYVNAATVAPIKEGQYVHVDGDTVLAKGGLSVWAPIGDIASDSVSVAK